MKFAKHLVSSAVAIAVAGTLSLAYAQTSTPGTNSTTSGAATVQQPSSKDASGTTTYSNTATPGAMNNSTAGTDTTNKPVTRMSKRRANGTTGTDMNADGSMSTERVARADRG